jgi:dienelactone hydrolase
LVTAIRNANWWAYFPNDYRWSFNMMIVMATIRTGGAEVGEIDAVGRRLVDHVGDDERWFDEWAKMGDHVRRLAEDAEADGRRLTSAAHYKRACCYYVAAERFRFPKDERALEVYRWCVECLRKATVLGDGPRVDYVHVPYENGATLPSYLAHAHVPGALKPPVVVLLTGFDGNKELNWFKGVDDLTRRGISVLAMDSPGVGEAIRFQGIPLRHDYEVAGSAAIDYLETREDVDASRVGIMAASLGGYYAPRCASMEPRFKACVAWGAVWDYHEVWRRRMAAAYEARLPVPADHLMWNTATDSPDAALAAIEGFRLDGVVEKMQCPFLLVHGEDDQQVPVADAHRLFEAVGSEDKMLRIFGNEEGGSQHCHVDNQSVAVPYIFDWLAGRLLR